ncbi:WSCD family member CG9164-like [Watersipora subatra]|uniref:WSCD family member CG9164-like n=1 Tax=Watersipora subatra TaxID=2589382 RepID=UPI00355BED69
MKCRKRVVISLICEEEMILYFTYLLLHSVQGRDVQKVINADSCKSIPDPVFLKPGALPITALASFQGSGNTWVRQLLAQSTGYKTGDIYKSYGDDFYPEFTSLSDDTVVAIKTHTFAEFMTESYSFKRALVIVRHPLDALYSEFNRMFGGNKTVYAEAVHLINEDGSLSWKWDVWMSHISSWVDFHKYWLKYFPGKVHVIYYNNLKRQTYSELTTAISFLDIQANMNRVNCTIEYPRPAYFQRPNIEPPVPKTKLFTLSMAKAKKAVQILKRLIAKKFGENSERYENFNLEISVEGLR